MSTETIEPIIYNVVATIGGKDLIPKVIRTVICYWNDDERQLHTNKLYNLLYFPDSPVNILIATALSESMEDDEGIWILTKRKYFIFTWDFGGYKKKNLTQKKKFPELYISKLYLASFLDFSREWDQSKDIPF